ncbi:glycine cleavage T C-terminal barrel domain-containing protein [Galbitalea sp. SE-J8]|uniref:CAF17-like 4Fe-4S cluster assembly/insertion protein YgfZ n=1 Tax=Galbitalea sp. SE-J8 TaxID=3054952 RepID=UPI00259D00C9|nr:glycine cleavage T C-terminal barrel domain-containing protein [Galbitalea sp. SE-J8]MDM4763767.1 glycine cleavage T C-terminal barrel domain-containing protein [Galbitalea sp. SE-J8]
MSAAATSPFARLPGAVGAPPEHYGEPVPEQRRLAAGRAVVDLSDRGVVTVTGPDRLSWLDSLTSQAVAKLASGVSAETLQLDPSGRIEFALRVVDDGVTTWLLVDPGQAEPLAAWLNRMRFMLRVEVADRSAEFATVGAFGDPADLSGDGVAAAAPNGVPLVWVDPWAAVQPGGWSYARAEHPASDWSYRELLVERDRLDAFAALPVAGTLALEALRIAAWRPRLATEVDATSIPHETDWLRSAVHLAKGCYRGQETVAKVHNLGHPPRRLVQLHLDGSQGVLPAPGDEVRLGDTVVGRVTAAARHHELGPIALAVVKRSTDAAADLVVATSDGALVAAAQEIVVPPDAGATADVPRLKRLGAR